MPGAPTATVVRSRSRPFSRNSRRRSLRSITISFMIGLTSRLAAGTQPVRPFGGPAG